MKELVIEPIGGFNSFVFPLAPIKRDSFLVSINSTIAYSIRATNTCMIHPTRYTSMAFRYFETGA